MAAATRTPTAVYGVFGWQDGSELYFRVPIGKNAHITPSSQYVVNPLLPEQDRDASSSAVVAGVRFHWSY